MDVVDKHLAKIGCTHFVKVLFTNARKLYSTKKSLNGNTTIGHKWYASLWNQIDSISFSNRKPLITNNMISSKIPLCASWSFGDGFCKRENLEDNTSG
jgi:hypothetical protein